MHYNTIIWFLCKSFSHILSQLFFLAAYPCTQAPHQPSLSIPTNALRAIALRSFSHSTTIFTRNNHFHAQRLFLHATTIFRLNDCFTRDDHLIRYNVHTRKRAANHFSWSAALFSFFPILATSYSPKEIPLSTIGGYGLNFCVRYGYRCDPIPIVTRISLSLWGFRFYPAPSKLYSKLHTHFPTITPTLLQLSTWSSPRLISIS